MFTVVLFIRICETVASHCKNSYGNFEKYFIMCPPAPTGGSYQVPSIFYIKFNDLIYTLKRSTKAIHN